MLSGIKNLTIEMAGTEEEVTEQLTAALEMEVEEDRDSKGKEGGDGTQRELGAPEFLTQDAELSRTTLIDAHNRFNKLSRLAMLWTVRHRWPAGVRFTFNSQKH